MQRGCIQQEAQVEVQPSFVLLPERFEEWRAAGPADGMKKFNDVLDLAVAELTEKYRLVAQGLAGDLRGMA